MDSFGLLDRPASDGLRLGGGAVGGNVRVGLEDNLWLEKGHLATNAELVARAVTIVEAMGVQVMTPDEVRDELQLTKRALP